MLHATGAISARTFFAGLLTAFAALPAYADSGATQAPCQPDYRDDAIGQAVYDALQQLYPCDEQSP